MTRSIGSRRIVSPSRERQGRMFANSSKTVRSSPDGVIPPSARLRAPDVRTRAPHRAVHLGNALHHGLRERGALGRQAGQADVAGFELEVEIQHLSRGL